MATLGFTQIPPLLKKKLKPAYKRQLNALSPAALQELKDNALFVAGIVHSTLQQDVWIAGGFPRDLALGRRPKDLDLWIRGRPDSKALEGLLGVLEMLNITKNSGQYEHQKLIIQHQGFYSRLMGRRVDLCFTGCDTLPEVLKGFDCGLCQIGWNLDGSIITLPGYDKDMRNGTLTFYCKQATDHTDRLKAKFPERARVYEKAPFGEVEGDGY